MVDISKKTILVTGSTGYIGSQIVNHLLKEDRLKDHIIRCAVRDTQNQHKIKPLAQLECADSHSRLEFVKFDLLDNDSVDKAVDGCQFIIHCAQPVTSDNSDREAVIKPAVEGTKAVMAAALKHKIKRVVYTGSISSMYDFTEVPNPINESHWSDPDLPSISAYNKSKILAERAAWDFLKELGPDQHKPELVAILPGFTLGEIIGKGTSCSVDVIKFLMRGRIKKVPRMEMKCVDVHDVAQAHVRALYIQEAAGNRFIIVDKPIWMTDIARVLSDYFDGKTHPKLPIPTQEFSLVEMWFGSWLDKTAANAYHYWNMQHNYDNSRSRQVLGIEYRRNPQEYIIETALNYITMGSVKFSD